MYFQGKKTEQNKIEDTLEKAGGEETMSDKLKVNMNEYLPLRDVVFNTPVSYTHLTLPTTPYV